jgi:putative PEP-CTERM system histidine kinase
MNLPAILSFTAAGFLAAASLVHAGRDARSGQRPLLIISFLLLAAVEASFGFLLTARTPQAAISAFRAPLGLSIVLPAVCLPLFFVYGRKHRKETVSKHAPKFVLLGVLLLAAALLIPVQLIVAEIHIAEEGAFWGFTFSGYAKGIGVFLLITNALCLYMFENTYRSANIPGKVILKYPLLGIITASVVNFVVISRVLAISLLDANFIAIQSCGFIALSATFLYSALRYEPLTVAAYIGRESPPSVITIVISSIYLLSLGLITLLARYAGMPYDRFTLSVLGIFVAFLLVAVLISGRARRSLRRFINENFYPTRYNYRREWRHYARLMASSQRIEDFLSNVISSLCETMLVNRGMIWIDVRGGMTAIYGPPEDRLADDLIAVLREMTAAEPVVLLKKSMLDRARASKTGRSGSSRRDTCEWVNAAAAVGHGEDFRGIIALGRKHMNTSYTEEDRDFLATIADQATQTLENLLMEERARESNQMESFNRFASFVIHDLKNTVGMLSLTAENAKNNIGNTEFQLDAMQTIKRSIEKMQGLIYSLSATKLPVPISRSRTDLVPLIEKSIESLEQAGSAKGVAIELEAGGEITAEVDQTALKRIMENLIINAIEASSEGRTVQVAVEAHGNEKVEIRVKDGGPGFDERYLSEHLFRPFHSTKKGGLGIGLVLCKSLAEAHGGGISITNDPGGGATVKVELPL